MCVLNDSAPILESLDNDDVNTFSYGNARIFYLLCVFLQMIVLLRRHAILINYLLIDVMSNI